jgi:hypothetical protein
MARGKRTPATAAWEVVLLRRHPGSRRARVAGRLRLEACDADAARLAARAGLTGRARGEPGWSLGVLRPLTPRAAGTRRYRVVFSAWEAEPDRFVRRDVHELTVWAENAASARRLAQEDVQAHPGYRPAWRIDRVIRDERPAAAPAVGSGSRSGAPDRLTLAPALRAGRPEGRPRGGARTRRPT